MNLPALAVITVTVWALMLMLFGMIILRLVSKVRVDIVLDDKDMLRLQDGKEIAITTNTVKTSLRYKPKVPERDTRGELL